MPQESLARRHPSAEPFATVLALCVKPASGAMMREVRMAEALVNGGLAGGVQPRPRRGVTLLSAPQWAQVTAELGVDLPWTDRRANILLDAPSPAELRGRRIRLGDAELQIHKETEPCYKMNRACPGLWEALKPDCRGGVYGQVLVAGLIRRGDPLLVVG